MGYCEGLGYAGGGGYVEGLAGPKKLARMIREGASPAAIAAERRAMRTRKLARKGTKLATGTPMQRGQFAQMRARVAAGTATRKERRMVAGIIPTPETAQAIERVMRKRRQTPAQEQELKRQQAAAAEAAAAQAEAAAAAEAARERTAAEEAQAREQRLADATAARDQRLADMEAERQIRAGEREADATRRAEDREIAQEQAEYEREMAAAGVYTGGGGGGAPWLTTSAPDSGGAPRPGLDMKTVLPIAAGAALLFLGS